MNPCILYFSRTGNTRLLAEAIANQTKAPIFSITACEPSIVEQYDTVIIGTPVEGASPTKEIMAFIDRLPRAQGKKAIFFSTYAMFGNERTMKKMEKKLEEKGYQGILRVSKKLKKNQPPDFLEPLAEMKKVL
jgi:flavodoxin